MSIFCSDSSTLIRILLRIPRPEIGNPWKRFHKPDKNGIFHKNSVISILLLEYLYELYSVTEGYVNICMSCLPLLKDTWISVWVIFRYWRIREYLYELSSVTERYVNICTSCLPLLKDTWISVWVIFRYWRTREYLYELSSVTEG